MPRVTKKVASVVSIPVIANGGAGKLEHIKEVIVKGGADAVSIASMVHYHFVKNYKLDKASFKEEGNIEYLQQKRDLSILEKRDILKIKEYLYLNNINCRYLDEDDLVLDSRRD